jgi:hypothetical protein
MAISHNVDNQGFTSAGTTGFTVNVNIGAGSPSRYMLVTVAYGERSDVVNSMTVDGNAATLVDRHRTAGTTQPYVQELWEFLNPPSGSVDVILTMVPAGTNPNHVSMSVAVYDGCDGRHAFQKDTFNGSALTVTMSPTDGWLHLGGSQYGGANYAPGASGSAGVVERWDDQTGTGAANDHGFFGGHKLSANLTWTMSTSNRIVHHAVDLKEFVPPPEFTGAFDLVGAADLDIDETFFTVDTGTFDLVGSALLDIDSDFTPFFFGLADPILATAVLDFTGLHERTGTVDLIATAVLDFDGFDVVPVFTGSFDLTASASAASTGTCQRNEPGLGTGRVGVWLAGIEVDPCPGTAGFRFIPRAFLDFTGFTQDFSGTFTLGATAALDIEGRLADAEFGRFDLAATAALDLDGTGFTVDTGSFDLVATASLDITGNVPGSTDFNGAFQLGATAALDVQGEVTYNGAFTLGATAALDIDGLFSSGEFDGSFDLVASAFLDLSFVPLQSGNPARSVSVDGRFPRATFDPSSSDADDFQDPAHADPRASQHGTVRTPEDQETT